MKLACLHVLVVLGVDIAVGGILRRLWRTTRLRAVVAACTTVLAAVDK